MKHFYKVALYLPLELFEVCPWIATQSHVLATAAKHKQHFCTWSFICQGTSTRIQQKELFSLQDKLPPVTTCLTTQS